MTPLHPQKLALTSPNGGGRSVGIVRSRTKATEFVCLFVPYLQLVRSTVVKQWETTSTWTFRSEGPGVAGESFAEFCSEVCWKVTTWKNLKTMGDNTKGNLK